MDGLTAVVVLSCLLCGRSLRKFTRLTKSRRRIYLHPSDFLCVQCRGNVCEAPPTIPLAFLEPKQDTRTVKPRPHAG